MVIPTPPPPEPTKELSDLESTLRDKQLEVDTLAETNRLLQVKIQELTKENSRMTKGQRKLKDEQDTLQAEAKIMRTTVTTYEEKITSLQKSIDEKDDELTAASGTKTPGNPDNLSTLTQLIERKFEQVENNLKQSIFAQVDKSSKQMEEKFSEVVNANKSYVDAVKNADTNSGTVREPDPSETNVDFRTIMRDERNEQLADEADKKQRACNFVVHGVVEGTGDKEKCKEDDNSAIASLLADLGVDVTFKAMYRLGNKRVESTEQSKRPLKVVMNNENDKDRIMASLKNLKDNEKYKRVSITDDYTTKERDTIKEWVKKAKDANANEPAESGYEWKVRGMPKNGMVLRKFRKRNPQIHA